MFRSGGLLHENKEWVMKNTFALFLLVFIVMGNGCTVVGINPEPVGDLKSRNQSVKRLIDIPLREIITTVEACDLSIIPEMRLRIVQEEPLLAVAKFCQNDTQCWIYYELSEREGGVTEVTAYLRHYSWAGDAENWIKFWGKRKKC